MYQSNSTILYKFSQYLEVFRQILPQRTFSHSSHFLNGPSKSIDKKKSKVLLCIFNLNNHLHSLQRRLFICFLRQAAIAKTKENLFHKVHIFSIRQALDRSTSILIEKMKYPYVWSLDPILVRCTRLSFHKSQKE